MTDDARPHPTVNRTQHMAVDAASTEAPAVPDEGPVVLYEVQDGISIVTMNRPDYRNAQNSVMTYALDDAFYRAPLALGDTAAASWSAADAHPLSE